MRIPAGTAVAAKLLQLRTNDTIRNSLPLPDEGATYFWSPSGHHGSVIVGADGAYLHMNALISWDQHWIAFASGQRTSGAS